MNTLDFDTKQDVEKTDVQSKKFDERLETALSNGTIVVNKNDDSVNDFRQLDLRGEVVINQEYFQGRISQELALLKRNPKSIKLLNRVGDIYFANLKFDKAKGFFKRAFKEDTDNLITANKLTQTYMALGKNELADQVLDLVTIKKDPNTLHLHAVLKMLRNSLDDAEALINNIEDNSSNYFEAINTLGLINLFRKDYSEAKKCFEKSRAKKEDYAPAQNNLAVAYQNEGQTDKAIKQYRFVIQNHRDYLVAYNNLYSLLVKEGKIQEAHDVMVSALHLSNEENDIQFRVGWALAEMNKYKDAIDAYEKVLDMLPGNANTLNNIGVCYVQLGDANNALDYFNRAIKNQKNNVIALKNLMELYESIGYQKESRRLARTVLQLEPNAPSALALYGDQFAEEEDWVKAFKIYLQAYDAKPPITSLYAGLTQIYADIYPDLEKGEEVAHYALENKLPNPERLFNNLAHLYLMHDEIKKAKTWVELLGKDPVSLATTALYHLKIDEPKDAKKLFEKAIRVSTGRNVELVTQRQSYDLGNYYYSKGKLEKALEYFNQIVQNKEKGYKYILASTKQITKEIREELAS